MKHVDSRDLIAGLLLLGFGLFVALYAGDQYRVGTAARMGPGFFPVVLGWVLVGLGSVIGLLAFRKSLHQLRPPAFALRSLGAVFGAILVFSLVVESLGLVPATVALTGVAVFAERPVKLRQSVLLAIALAVLAWVIFSFALQMTLPAFTFLD